jgi:hypothetical protein
MVECIHMLKGALDANKSVPFFLANLSLRTAEVMLKSLAT